MTPATALKPVVTEDEMENMTSALDAILWLEWQKKQGHVDQWVKRPSRYRLDPVLTSHRFAITYDQSGKWVLAALDDPTMAWFVGVPWDGLYLHHGDNPTMTLVCPALEAPTEELLGKSTTLPMFGLDIPGSGKILPVLAGDDEIRVGTFSYGPQNQFTLGNTFRDVPIVQKS